jgi:hypothetical protein
MTDNPTHAALAHVLGAYRITGPEEFQRRYGVPPASLSAAAALTVVTWMENAGSTPVVWMPQAVRAFAARHGLVQDDGESDHAFTVRLRAAIHAR